MTPTPPDVKSIFGHALEIDSPAGRAAYLDEACGPDGGLRAEVEGLLATLGRAGAFMCRPAAAVAAGITASFEPLTERPGTKVGPYKLLQQIGEGGMGVVYMAEQEEPVRRKVALKIIKPGMDSKQVVARFEAERQALAMMDHVNIAKVFDAGATETGRPYFVMELVHGVPITDYCDANQLTPRQRLELFVPVCQAIQHAHQKGIIHRDIKPSNILVTMYDDKPVPKVIDFGVAKAVEQRLTEKTLFTQFGTLVGTFEYMSPEQAEMNALGVDTRSDIYALGVLLYELMTGTTPLERVKLREAAFSEIVRRIKEEEPPKPSVRLSTSDTLAKVAAARKTEPGKLSRLMRGELDWVVMKCLEKDRSRRYDTASGLAKDVERYLKYEPVEARPPSAWYRLRKAARRNRTALAVTGVVAAALVLGTAATLLQASIARAERERAEAQRLEDQASADADLRKQLADAERRHALDRAIEAAFSGDLAKTRKAIAAAEQAEVARDQIRWLNGLVHFQRGKYEEAIKEFEASLELKRTAAALGMLARAHLAANLHTHSFEGFAKALTELREAIPVTPEDYMCRGLAFSSLARDQSIADLDKAVELRDSPIARAFRSHSFGLIALDTRDAKLYERMLDDIREAKKRLSDIPYVRYLSCGSHMNAAGFYGETKQFDKQKDALAEAKEDAQELEKYPIPIYVGARVRYFQAVGDEDAVLNVLEQACQREETKMLATSYAQALYRNNRAEDALKVLDKSRQPEIMPAKILRIFLLAEVHGADRAYQTFQDFALADPGMLQLSGIEPQPLLFLGKNAERARLQPAGFPGKAPARDSRQPITEYIAGKISEKEFLAPQGKIPSQMYQCVAHFWIGLDRLSKGDRKGARESFEKCVATRWLGLTVYPYAEIFLARMKNDPKWPKWIPVKK
jgi:serine/threonine protein kinase